MLTAAGVGSGLDIESMISQLMALERRPLNRLESRKSGVQAHISANGQLKGAIARLQSAAKALTEGGSLGGVTAASSDEAVLTVSATAGADTQGHDVVVTQTAARHRLASNAYADENTSVGTGTLDITVGGNTLSLALDAGNSTLAQIRDAINADAANPGVVASIINVDAGSQLVFTARDTGTANAVTVTPGGGLAGFATSQVNAARDATLTVDGFAVTSASNTITGVIAGVTLELKGAGNASVDFTGDSSVLSAAVEELVNAYNNLRGNIKALGRNALKGDSLLLGLERSINQRLSTPVTLPDASTAYLFEMGVSFNDQGDLQFNAADLAETVGAGATRVLDFFGAAGGLAAGLDAHLEGYLQSDGILDARTDTLEGRTRSLDRQIENLEFRLEKTEERLRAQFTSLDSLLAQLTVTSDFLAQQLLSLPSVSRNGS